MQHQKRHEPPSTTRPASQAGPQIEPELQPEADPLAGDVGEASRASASAHRQADGGEGGEGGGEGAAHPGGVRYDSDRAYATARTPRCLGLAVDRNLRRADGQEGGLEHGAVCPASGDDWPNGRQLVFRTALGLTC